MNRPSWSPPCSVFAFSILLAGVLGAPNGLERRPARGWSSWNLYEHNINTALFLNATQSLIDSGLFAAGYDLIAIDGGWWEGTDTGRLVRNASGFMQADAVKFGGNEGMKALIAEVHARGFRWLHYTDAGQAACNGDRPMSEGFEAQDVALFFSDWSADALKLDSCSVAAPSPEPLVANWSALMNATGRNIEFHDCSNGCRTIDTSRPWAPWCAALLNSWRTSADISATWSSILHNLDSLKGNGGIAAPGNWNDPDGIMVGIHDMSWGPETFGMCRSQVALWSVTSSPLMIGFDFAAQPPEVFELFLNPRMLQVNELYAGNAGDFLRNGSAGGEIWAKPLPNASAAVVLFNRLNQTESPEPVDIRQQQWKQQ